ncbi:hypothetical protein [Clostridium ihumii]|uniref:hypothetical protein n=1 Tax=Clostridium ihumii TaxID=1470356 RepID=UPI0005900494|nr:hypothetical protein [Clostridium ihumii]
MYVSVIAVNGTLDKLTEGVQTIARGFEYLFHPTHILIDLWNGLVEISTPICITSALACIILYALGYKKYGKGITLSFIIYILIQAIGVISK